MNKLEAQELVDINKKAQEDHLSSLSGDGTGPIPPVWRLNQ